MAQFYACVTTPITADFGRKTWAVSLIPKFLHCAPRILLYIEIGCKWQLVLIRLMSYENSFLPRINDQLSLQRNFVYPGAEKRQAN